MKVGADVDDDLRRGRIIRDEIGAERMLAVDANQRWDVERGDRLDDGARAASTRSGSRSPPVRTTSSGMPRSRVRVAPVRVATGEHVHNRVMFKQLFQAAAIDVCQIDACRSAGVNEVLAVMLMAAEVGVPVCPHAGGVGLCELVQHLSVIDYVASAARSMAG